MRVGLLFFFVGFWGLSPAFAEDLPAYREVTSQISRGGRPIAEGLVELKRMGVRTVIDLEETNQAVAAERVQAARLGLAWTSEPMLASQTPNDAQVTRVLSLLSDSRRYPIYIHCRHGQDRTGLMIGLYRVLMQRWTPEQAYREMLELGFHSEYQALDRYFKVRAGLR